MSERFIAPLFLPHLQICVLRRICLLERPNGLLGSTLFDLATWFTNVEKPNTLMMYCRCQTYEGGFAGFIGGEAHGGYTFCAVAALVLLKSENLMDRNALVRWLVGRQLSLEGGFQVNQFTFNFYEPSLF